MRDLSAIDVRRTAPRVDVEAFCSEMIERGERPGLVIDLSEGGFRIERPYVGGRTPAEILLELEVPAIDEVIWTRTAVCFDRIRPAPAGRHGGPFGFLRTTGLRIIGAAARDLRLLRDCVWELRAARRVTDGDDLAMASCYLRG